MTTTDETQDRKPTRTKNPSYDVFRQNGDTGWELLMSDVKARNRRDAIVAAATETATQESDQYGVFAVIKHGEFKTLTRARKVEPQDVWT